jgi:hypothetical protein
MQKYFIAESGVQELACGACNTSIHHAPKDRHILAADI